MEGSGARRYTTVACAIVTILVIGLLGGLLHHHESQSDESACCYCHAGLHTPVFNLAGSLAITTFVPAGFVTRTRPPRVPRVVRFSTLAPRAPPVATHPAIV